MAMLLPALRNARNQAYNIACKNNLRQQYLAICSYAQDFDERLPPTPIQLHTEQLWAKDDGTWHRNCLGLLAPDYLTVDVLFCPSRKGSEKQNCQLENSC